MLNEHAFDPTSPTRLSEDNDYHERAMTGMNCGHLYPLLRALLVERRASYACDGFGKSLAERAELSGNLREAGIAVDIALANFVRDVK